MKNRFITAGIFLFLIFSGSVFPQEVPGGLNADEKKPTSRDPRYVPSLIPPSIRKTIKPGAKQLFSPGGVIDAESYMEEEANKKKKNLFQRHIEQQDEDLMNYDEYLYFQKSLSSQFGINSYHMMDEQKHYHETSGRRFQIIFFTSLPVTGALAYAAGVSAKGSSRMNSEQTAAIAFAAISASSAIGWYDNRQWKKGRTFKDNLKDSSFDSSKGSENPTDYSTAAPALPAKVQDPQVFHLQLKVLF